MVIMRRTGVVEQGGVEGVAGVLEGDVFDAHVLCSFPRDELVEFLHEGGLVGCPGYLEPCGAEEAGDAFALEGGVVVELGDVVDLSAALEALLEEGGFGLEVVLAWVRIAWFGVGDIRRLDRSRRLIVKRPMASLIVS